MRWVFASLVVVVALALYGCGSSVSGQASPTKHSVYCGGNGFRCYSNITDSTKIKLDNSWAQVVNAIPTSNSLSQGYFFVVEQACGYNSYENTTILPGLVGVKHTHTFKEDGRVVGNDTIWWRLKCPNSQLEQDSTGNVVIELQVTNGGKVIPENTNAALIYQAAPNE